MADQPVNDPQNPDNSTPPIASNRKWIILLVILVIVGFSLASLLIGYILANKNEPAPSPATPTPSAAAPTLPPPSTNEPTIKSATPKPTLPPNPKGNTYRSDKLNFAFYYASKLSGSTETFSVSEAGNKVYVYPKSQNSESGQFVESFSKDPKETLAQAITRQFLPGISTDTCYVTHLDSQQAGIEKAIIDYPVPPDAEPMYMSDACPLKYSRANGIRYFYYDPQVPDKFFYFDIGQYAIPAYNDNPEIPWQDTFSVNP